MAYVNIYFLFLNIIFLYFYILYKNKIKKIFGIHKYEMSWIWCGKTPYEKVEKNIYFSTLNSTHKNEMS